MKRIAAVLSAALTVFLLLAVAVGALIIYRFGRDLPDIEQLAVYDPPVTTRVYAGDGRMMAEYAAEKRIFVPIGAIPERVIQAFLAAEDKNFYQHRGVDVTGVIRAVLTNVENFGSDRRLVGASTITQQVAKNFLLSGEVSFERKVKEAILAFRIDRAFSKNRILELYLNEIYLGAGSYGVAAAALNYFDKSLLELSVGEAAVLAALPKAPSNYDPVRQPAAAKARRDWVIGRMLEEGQLSEEEARAAIDEPLTLRRRQQVEPVRAEYFAEEVRRELVRRYGETALYQGGLLVHTTIDPAMQVIADRALRNGLAEFDRRRGWRGPVGRLADGTLPAGGSAAAAPASTADWAEALARQAPPPGMLESWRLAVVLRRDNAGAEIGFADGSRGQITAESLRFTQQHARGYAGRLQAGDLVPVEAASGHRWAIQQIPLVQGALVAVDPRTGRVLAMSGGWDYSLSQFNRATQAQRQPGSTFKPIVYLCALEADYTPSSVIQDAPLSVSRGPGEPPWTPENYSHRFYGPTTLRVGLEQSRNVTTVRLALQLGMDRVVDCARRLGVDEHMRPYPAYALGAGETTLLRMTTAYAMLVNGGKRIVPSLVDRVQDRYGRIIFRHETRACPECQDVAWENQPVPEPPDAADDVTDPFSAYQVVSMLQGVVERGTGQRVKEVGRPLAGKTGTSSDAKDVWFVGFSPDLAAGVFLGYDEPESLGDHAAGGTLAAPIFADFMAHALAGTPAIPFRTPPGVRLVRVDAATGEPASSSNPRVIFEAFKPGTAPVASGGSGGGSRPPRAVASPDVGTGGLY